MTAIEEVDKMKALKIFVIFVLLLLYQSAALAEEGQLIQTTISAPSLGNNLFEDITEQSIIIYLPPSYDTTNLNYPVVYFLPGFSTPNTDFINGSFQGYRLKNSMDDLIQREIIKEMIVVIPNGLTFLLGSYYVNTSVTGNWEDYMTRDLIDYMDANYRTLSDANSRGIAGHSMGGFGALNLAMLHPNVFCATYGLSPGLFDLNGLNDQGMFSSQTKINQFIAKLDEWLTMDKDSAVASFKEYINYLKSRNDYDTIFSYAYGAAFSPNPEKHPPYIDYPYYKEGEETLCDSTLRRNYENGFGGLAEKVTLYKENLLSLKAMTIDYGIFDYYSWIRRGCVYFSQLLTDAEIPHDLLSFNGDHGDMVKSRIENSIMPFFSKTLTFETSVNPGQKSKIPSEFDLTNYPNPFNPSTTIVFNLPKTSFIILKVYNLYGQEIETLKKGVLSKGKHTVKWTAENLPSGIYFCRLETGQYFEARKFILQK
jgi:S-formylglutathione hydrolase